MTRPTTPFEAASYDLIKFRERRVAERRAVPRGTVDRRVAQAGSGPYGERNGPDTDTNGNAGVPGDKGN